MEIYPNGILLNLYKHIDASKIDRRKINDKFVDLKTKVAFGNFDRLRFYPIEDFAEFRKQSCTGHLWIGGRRDIMLFSLTEDENKRSFHFSCSDADIAKAKEKNDPSCKDILPWEIKMHYNKKPTSKRFLSVSMLYMSGKIKNLGLSYKDLVSRCEKAISGIVKKVNSERPGHELIFEVFGSLNSAELAILWGADQYADVQYIVDQLRYLKLHLLSDDSKHRVFYSSYTIIAFYNHAPDNLSDVRGGSMIQFTTSTKIQKFHSSQLKALNYISKNTTALEKANVNGTICSCAGEYDHIYSGSAVVLSSLARHGDSQAFDDCNSGFRQHFTSTTTRLNYQKDDVLEIITILKRDLPRLLLIPVDSSVLPAVRPQERWEMLPQVFNGRTKDAVRSKYLRYIEKLTALFLENTQERGLAVSNFLYNLELLFCDYVQCVSTMPDLQWAKDFEYQFSSALSVLEQTLPSATDLAKPKTDPFIPNKLDDYISRGHKIISLLQNNIHHMSEAGKLFFEEPTSHSESTGQYDLIIHTYYGIIKNVLLEIDKNRQYLKQNPTPLVPILRFSEEPIIRSILYIDGTDLDKKLVDIRIPYDACGEIGLYSPLLIHEIYHYVPPVDRSVRNYVFAVLLLTELTVDKLQQIAAGLSDIPQDGLRALCLKFRQLLIPTVYSTLLDVIKMEFSIYDPWSSFSNDLKLWIRGFNRSGNESESFQNYYSALLSGINKSLHDWENSLTANQPAMGLVSKLSTLIAPSALTKECLLRQLQISDNIVYKEIEMALRELLPDYAMLHYAGMQSLSDYLLLIAIVFDKQYCNAVYEDNQSFLALRLSFAADYLLYQFHGDMQSLIDDLRDCEQPFIQSYNAYRLLGIGNSSIGGQDYQREAHLWFDFFVNRLLSWNGIYHLYRPLLSQLAETQFKAGMMSSTEPTWQSLIAPFDTLRASRTLHFRAEVDVIYAFQPQWFLEELQTYTMPAPAPSTPSMPSYQIPAGVACDPRDFRIENAVEAAIAIKAATEILQSNHRAVFGQQSNPRLWFRGCNSSKLSILPSIMVHFLDRDKTCPNGKNYIGTLVEYQRALLEEFKYRADGASEFINPSSYTTADYISLMQHYSQKTCYLDWSDDVYSSLYFALENEIKEAQKPYAEQKPTSEDSPVLYLFDPKLYNLARLRMLNRYSADINKQFPSPKGRKPDPKTASLFETIQKDLAEAKHVEEELQSKRLSDVSVPNISMSYTAKRHGIHSYNLIYQNGPAETALRNKEITTRKKIEDATFAVDGFTGDLWNLPMAIYTSRLNPRIRTQSGNFLAYSVFTRPVCCEEELSPHRSAPDLENNIKAEYFNYISLKKIQEFYLDTFSGDPQPGLPFLLEVIIPKGEKHALAEYLYHAGINKYRIYPELDNLSLS